MFKELRTVCEYHRNMQVIGEELDKMATKPFAEYLISKLNTDGYHMKNRNVLCVKISIEKASEFMTNNPGDPHSKYGIVGYIERALFHHGMAEYVSWDYTDNYKKMEFQVDMERVLGGR